MPKKRCQRDNNKGWKWGDRGFCFTYAEGDEESEQRAKDKADKQGRAIEANKSRK